MDFYDKHMKALEFDKVLEKLAQFTSCEDARYNALHLKPETNLELAKALLNQTTDAHMLLARFGGPSFGGLKNVKALDVLPYHSMGERKYSELGIDYPLSGMESLDKSEAQKAKGYILEGIIQARRNK